MDSSTKDQGEPDASVTASKGTRKRKQTTATMAVLGATKFGSPATSVLSFTQVAKPQSESLGPTEVIIRVAFSDLNPVDHHKLKGNNKQPPATDVPNPPLIVGFGGSGMVESIHENAEEETKKLLGKKVVFIADPHPTKSGSYAEYIVCDRRIVAEIPVTDDGTVSLREAASVPIAGCTALESLANVGLPISSPSSNGSANSTGEGKRLLVVGGAGGVGSWTAQLARACYPDLEIICTASSSSEWCQRMGADRTIPHDQVITLGGGPKGSVDSIICLTEPTANLFNTLSEVLRPYGKICLVVAGAGITSLDLGFVFFKCGSVSTQTVFSSVRDGYRLDQSGEMGTILDLMKDGKVKAPLNLILDREDATSTSEIDKDSWKGAVKEGGFIDMVGSGHCRGKLVMKID